MKPVVVFGASGMLGSMVTSYLSQYMPVVTTVRTMEQSKTITNVEWRTYDVLKGTKSDVEAILSCNPSWIINCIGMIGQRHTAQEMQTWSPIVNSWFPSMLSCAAEVHNAHIIQPATDCVFSGKRGDYTESDHPDAQDVYGKSKAMGEIERQNLHYLRCSLVGTESHGKSLLGWFLSRPENAIVNGYTNHIWNGITTLAFAEICRGIIENSVQLGHMQHIVPTGSLSKYELLVNFGKYFKREDIEVVPDSSQEAKNMTLQTEHQFDNLSLWNFAEHDKPPTIRNMVRQLAKYEEKHGICNQ